MDKLIDASAARIFSDHSDNAIALWSALEESELTKAWIPQSMGGAGLSVTDVFGLIRLSGTAVQSVPFTETLLASYLLSSAGLPTPSGPVSIASTTDIAGYSENDTHDSANNVSNGNVFNLATSIEVPFGNTVDYVAAMTGNTSVSLFRVTDAEPASSVGSDPLYKLSLDTAEPESTAALPDGFSIETFGRTGALARAAQMCGAMDAIVDLTLTHTATREQFGRPLAKFQAVQHLLAEIAGEAAASSAIVEAAVEAFEQLNRPDFRTTASAKARTSEAAGIIAANAHQAHGAIGYTQEYALSAYTRRLWRWREEFGNETQWALALGKDYLRADAGTLTEEFLV